MKTKSILPSFWSRPSSEVAPLRTLQSEINSLFNDFGMNPPMPQFWASERSGYLDMCCEVSETDKAFELTAEMPGVDEKDIEVTLVGDVLKIRAEKKANKEEKTKDYHMVERSYGTFQRSLMLPFHAEPGKIDAKLTQGVLKVVVPKPAESQAQVRKIEVKAAA